MRVAAAAKRVRCTMGSSAASCGVCEEIFGAAYATFVAKARWRCVSGDKAHGAFMSAWKINTQLQKMCPGLFHLDLRIKNDRGHVHDWGLTPFKTKFFFWPISNRWLRVESENHTSSSYTTLKQRTRTRNRNKQQRCWYSTQAKTTNAALRGQIYNSGLTSASFTKSISWRNCLSEWQTSRYIRGDPRTGYKCYKINRKKGRLETHVPTPKLFNLSCHLIS